MKLRLLALAALIGLSACSTDTETPRQKDAEVDDDGGVAIDTGGRPDTGSGSDASPADDAGELDATPLDGASPDASADAGGLDAGPRDATPVDAALDAGAPDLGPRDAAVDAGRPDTGVDAGALSFSPGQRVDFAEGRVSVGDTYAQVVGAIGAPTTTPQGDSRAYGFTLPSGPAATVWFADTNLSQGAVEPTDRVLWIAVGTDYPGRAQSGLHTGLTRTGVQTLYGAPDKSVPVDQPAGTLDAYYGRGFLVAYDPQLRVRTITVTREYPAPSASFDVGTGSIGFNPAIVASAVRGSPRATVISALGEPDSSGNVTLGGQSLEMLGYSFIGIELFLLPGGNGSTVLFASVHAPYYGTMPGGVGIGSTRTQFESAIQSAGFLTPGQPTQANASIICYTDSFGFKGVAATFSQASPSLVTSIVVGYPGFSCP